jgi:ribonuclease-3 family protein
MEIDRFYYMNTTTLAYMGDAIYEAYVRAHLLRSGATDTNRLHKAAVTFVRADAQAAAVRELLPSLSEEEQSLVRRARNKRSISKAKHADPVTYKWATAFEALIGYLFLAGKTEQMEEIIARAIRSTGGENGKKTSEKSVSGPTGGLLSDQPGGDKGSG